MIAVGSPVHIDGVVLGKVVSVLPNGGVVVDGVTGRYRITVPRPGKTWLLVERLAA